MDRLIDQKRERLKECTLKIQYWKNFKSDYDALEHRLSTLADKLTYDIMVPFGSKAFMPGTMVHTNNITVLLGDNWFTEMSTKQAVEFIERRKQQCIEMLEELKKEQKQYQNWLEMTENISEEQPNEIIETCSEEELAQWREQHRKNVSAHKQKEAQNRAAEKDLNHVGFSSVNGVQSDESYSEKLDELMEECSKQINNSNSDTEDDLSEDSQEEEDSEPKPMNIDSAEKNEDALQTNSNERNENDLFSIEDRNEKRDKHVRWIDISEANSKCINFTHSKLPPIQQYNKKKNKRRRRNSSTSDFEEEEFEDKNCNGSPRINSPSDIYKCFSFICQKSKPKSILKSNSNEMRDSSEKNVHVNGNENEQSMMEFETTDKYINNCLSKKVNDNLAFTGEVREHSSENTPQITTTPFERPKSLFRSSRQNATDH